MSTLRARIADHGSPDSWSGRRRQARHELLVSALADRKEPISILDVGGTQSYWDLCGIPPGVTSITLLNRDTQPVTSEAFVSVVGDATSLSDFSEGQFDMVFSNSVIEHVGGPDQRRLMADAVRRVGLRYFVQTPNRYFPIEPHFHLPWFQLWPAAWRAQLLRRRNLGWVGRRSDPAEARRMVESVDLLTRREMRRLFPDAQLVPDKAFGLTKSLIAIYGAPPGILAS